MSLCCFPKWEGDTSSPYSSPSALDPHCFFDKWNTGGDDDDDDDDVLLLRPEDTSLVEVYASAAGRRQVQSAVHSLGRPTRGRLSHRTRTVQTRGAALGSSEEQPDHDLRQTQSIAQVLLLILSNN